MAVTLVPRDDTLDLEITGWADQMWCLSTGVQIPWEDVVGARVQTWDEVRAGLGWRVGGAYWPGWIATGWYTVPGVKGDRQLLGVFRKRRELVVVETRRPRPRRLVVPSDHAAAMVEEIIRRAGGHTS
jgi:hypothetical protein